MKKIFLLFIPILSFGQKDVEMIECNIKSLKTTCLESSKIISEVKYKVQHSDFGRAKIDKIYGRFEDLKTGLSDNNFKQNKIDLTCEQLIYDKENEIYYSQENNDQRKFYFLYKSGDLIYKGTENLQQIKPINLNSGSKYFALYDKEHENDENYEVSYNYYNPNGRLVYTFHQRANEFNEFTYEYNRSLEYHIIYKNGSVWKEYSNNHHEDEIIENTITEYIIPESYQLDRKNHPYLKESKFIKKEKNCNCKEGYVTTIEFWDKNKCYDEYILE
jgi:hypothetical protein